MGGVLLAAYTFNLVNKFREINDLLQRHPQRVSIKYLLHKFSLKVCVVGQHQFWQMEKFIAGIQREISFVLM